MWALETPIWADSFLRTGHVERAVIPSYIYNLSIVHQAVEIKIEMTMKVQYKDNARISQKTGYSHYESAADGCGENYCQHTNISDVHRIFEHSFPHLSLIEA